MRILVHLWVYSLALTVLVGTSHAQEPESPPPFTPAPTAPPPPPSPQPEPGSTEKPTNPDVPRPCDVNFYKPCDEGLVCIDQKCVPKPKVKKKSKRTRSSSIAADEEEAVQPESRAFRFGATNAFFFGIGGKLSNPRPAYNLLGDFGFPSGRHMRWHVELGYENLSGFTGFRLNPFILGYEIPILREPVRLEVEVIASILQSEVLFNNGYAIALSSGLKAQVVVVYGAAFAGFAPLGFEIRYAYGLQSIGIDTGVGANWPLQLTVGVEL
jgi:hypothetical protein